MLSVASGPKRCSDGKRCNFSGEHTFAALHQLKTIYDNPEERDKYTWPENLVKGLEVGVDCQIVRVTDDDYDRVIAFNALAHGESTNKLRLTGVQEYVELAERVRLNTAGGSWADAQTSLLNIYGASKRMLVYRVVAAAMALPRPIIQKITEVGVPTSYADGNTLFAGTGLAGRSA